MKPCPFCGSDQIKTGTRTCGHGESESFLRCEKCGGSMADYADGVIWKWQQRTYSVEESMSITPKLAQFVANAGGMVSLKIEFENDANRWQVTTQVTAWTFVGVGKNIRVACDNIWTAIEERRKLNTSL